MFVKPRFTFKTEIEKGNPSFQKFRSLNFNPFFTKSHNFCSGKPNFIFTDKFNVENKNPLFQNLGSSNFNPFFMKGHNFCSMPKPVEINTIITKDNTSGTIYDIITEKLKKKVVFSVFLFLVRIIGFYVEICLIIYLSFLFFIVPMLCLFFIVPILCLLF